MKTLKIVVCGLSLALVPVLALATSPPSEEDGSSTQSSPSVSSVQNTDELSRPGGASGMEDQSGSMQRERQQQLKGSHESSSAMARQHQKQGVGSMNDDNTTKTPQGSAEIPDERTQDDTAPPSP